MARVDEQPHTLLGGRTRAGKTWLAMALLERRIDAGADIFILDPHGSDEMGLPTADTRMAEEIAELRARVAELEAERSIFTHEDTVQSTPVYQTLAQEQPTAGYTAHTTQGDIVAA
jgi:hypothetical protein